MLASYLKAADPPAFYTTDFGSETVGSLPSGWSYVSSNAASSQAIVADAATISGKKLQANYAQFLYLTTSPPVEDVDIFAIIRYDNSTSAQPAGPFGRKSGDTTSIGAALNNTYYAGKVSSGSSIALQYRNNVGTATTLQSASTSLLNSDWIKIRLRLTGTNQEAKVWRNDQTEPVAWQLVGASTTLTAAGLVGIRSSLNNVAAILECQYFSVGADGYPPNII